MGSGGRCGDRGEGMEEEREKGEMGRRVDFLLYWSCFVYPMFVELNRPA